MIDFGVVDPRADTGVDESENWNHRVVRETKIAVHREKAF